MAERFEQHNQAESQETEEFKGKKREFFNKLGLRVRDAFKMHKEAGLWGKKNSKEDWRNVSEHCLVEATRAEVFADKLELSEDIKKDLILAAALHDFFKKGEIDIYRTEGMTWDNYKKAEEKGSELLKEKGFDSRTVRLAGSIGVIGAGEAKSILERENISHEDTAFLILHYIDAYTNGSDWAGASEIGEGGDRINDINRRQKASALKYKSLFENGRSHFNGESPIDVEIEVDHLIGKRITELLKERSGTDIDPIDLPEFIDNEIRGKIESIEE